MKKTILAALLLLNGEVFAQNVQNQENLNEEVNQYFYTACHDRKDLLACGTLEFRKGNNQGAIDYYDQHLMLKPIELNAISSKAKVYRDMGDAQKSNLVWENYLKFLRSLDVNSPQVERLTQEHFRGFYDSFSKEGKKTARENYLNHEQSMAYEFWGRELYDNGDFRGAVDCFSKLVAINPEFYNAYSMLAQSQRQIGQLKEAMDSINLAIKYAPEDTFGGKQYAQFYFIRATIYYLQSEYQQAINDADRSLKSENAAIYADEVQQIKIMALKKLETQ